MLRLMGRVDRATEIIRPIHERLEKEGKPDGWISEEYAECLLAAGHVNEAKPHFKVAYDRQKNVAWALKNEPAKLERLRRLAGEQYIGVLATGYLLPARRQLQPAPCE